MQQAWPISGEAELEEEKGCVVGARFTYAAGLADQWRARLQRRLDVRRRHVLASRADDQLLLAIDDSQVALLVEDTDVARAQPAILGEGLAGLLWEIAIAEHHDFGFDEHLTVAVQLDLDPRRGWADGTDPDLSGWVDATRAAGLAHTPKLSQRQADRVEELEHLDRRGRGADVDRLDFVEAERRAQPR